MSQENVTHLNRNFGKPVGGFDSGSTAPKKKFTAVGHDKQLEEAQFGKLPVHVRMISGEFVRGIIVRRDRYTITVRHVTGSNDGLDEIIYKHAIEGVLIERKDVTIQ